MALLDATGQPLASSAVPPREDNARQLAVQLRDALGKLGTARRDMLRAKFDAAQTFTANESHWGNADHLDPHTVASLAVRRTLRSRSRYEVVENNPYLKGTVLTIVNDFIGSCPKLQITDDRLSDARRTAIEDRFQEWAKVVCLREKLWRMRMSKIVDGESFMMPYVNKRRRPKYPVALDLYVIECDRISGQTEVLDARSQLAEIDGVRFDEYENPTEYFVLYQHPGGSPLNNFAMSRPANGKWVPAEYMIHWFRKDRGWLRGIPETTPSLPLCALLRRYTLATVRNAEVITDFTVLLQTENPAASNPFTDGAGNLLVDDPFDLFPLEMGMAMTLPYGYKASQLKGVPSGAAFDEFVAALLREITRPLLTPYNMASGTSKDSNMASGVLDQHIYRGGQKAERVHCEDHLLCRIFEWWWTEAMLSPGYLGDNLLASDRSYSTVPKHRWRWDEIGIEHTDPDKVAKALETMHKNRFITDADIQEGRMNRRVEDWRAEIEEDDKFRMKLKPLAPEDRPENQPKPAKPPGFPQKKTAKARRRRFTKLSRR